ncbi:Oligopeptide transporter, OPT superfamily [Dillenia turbinata]|uniref:Oligopeptide transporter, OPT superfamily n=1 Tax=Dillenia turbinata TaxID=194707 RepID=A0AAN8ZN20_9MAGN
MDVSDVGLGPFLMCPRLSSTNSSHTGDILSSIFLIRVATLPMGRFMASALFTTKFRVSSFGSMEFSLNPGPSNMKEHVFISTFANAGSAFGNGKRFCC